MHDPPRILIVDDIETNRDILDARLRSHGYELIQAADAEEAMVATMRHQPDLIPVDVIMPGIEVTRRLKGDASLPFRRKQRGRASTPVPPNRSAIKADDPADTMSAMCHRTKPLAVGRSGTRHELSSTR
jgi:CheY-like chemotaxis protein